MKEFWQIMLRYVAPYKRFLGGAVIMNILSAVLNIFSFALIIPMLKILFGLEQGSYEFIPWDAAGTDLMGKLTNNSYYYVTEFSQTIGASKVLLLLCLFVSVTTILKTACYFGASAVMIPIRTGVVKDIRMEIYNKILSLPIGFFSEEKKGDIIARMSGDVQEVENSITSSIEVLIKNPILILFYFGTLLFISWQLTLFTIIFVPVMGWIMGAIGKQLKRGSLEAQALWSDQASAHPVSECLGTIMICIVLWFGGTLILSDNAPIDAPTFIYYMVILYSVINPLKEFSKASYAIPKGLASMERINKILEADNSIQEPVQPAKLDGFREKISFHDVSFRYNDSRQILFDIDLDIEKGKTVAIVGESGAGKSTLVDLIPRFYDPTKGKITIDGTDIRSFRSADLRSMMGIVNQEPILFNDTIFNNIAFGVEDATMEQVIEAAKVANAHEFIMEKEEGYQTNIGDRGVKLSGGQRQRLSIARAILKNPPILILDEATASLDTESERIVQEALDHLMSTRTTIAIAHRLSTIKNADEIIVMKEGRIVERGRHDELLALDGYYKKLHDMQAL